MRFYILVILLWLTTSDSEAMSDPSENIRNANEYLLEKWQDWILSNAIAVNHLNCLITMASRTDFPLTIPNGYAVKHIPNPNSFRLTSSHLATRFRAAFTYAREDLNRVYVGMQRVPDQLKEVLLLLKMGPFDLIQMLFPDFFQNMEKLVNDSLIVLRRPEKSFVEVSNLITEMYVLLSDGLADESVKLQIMDLKTQWEYLVHLTFELSQRAEIVRENFLLQLNWILREFIQPHITNPDNHREFFIDLLLSQIIAIDQTCDLLGTISQTYTDMAFQWTDDQISSNGHLLLLNNEVERKQYIQQYRSSLPNQVVHISRLALKRHEELVQRNNVRKMDFQQFLDDASMSDLTRFLLKLNNRSNL